MDLLVIGAAALVAGIMFRVISVLWKRKLPTGGALRHSSTSMSIERDEFRDAMVSLQAENPGLPAVPADQMLYEFWFTEARKWIATNARRRSRGAELKLAALENQYEREKLSYLETKHKQKEILTLSDLEIEAKKQALLYQAEESKVKREALHAPATDRPAPAVRETESERKARLMSQYNRARETELRTFLAGRTFESLPDREKELYSKINNSYDDKISDLYNK
jgi:hypothetical protein